MYHLLIELLPLWGILIANDVVCCVAENGIFILLEKADSLFKTERWWVTWVLCFIFKTRRLPLNYPSHFHLRDAFTNFFSKNCTSKLFSSLTLYPAVTFPRPSYIGKFSQWRRKYLYRFNNRSIFWAFIMYESYTL